MVIYERHAVPRAERRIFDLEQDKLRMLEQLEFFQNQVRALEKTVEILRKQIQEQEHENDVLVRTNQYLEYHVTDYF